MSGNEAGTQNRTNGRPPAGDLLEGVLDAHGGLESWGTVTELTAQLSFGGPFWAVRGWADVYTRQTVTLDPHRERITFTPFTGPGRTSVFEVDPERVSIRSADGTVVEERSARRDSFPLPFDDFATPWDALQVACFTSAATWNYLTAPFVSPTRESRLARSSPGTRMVRAGVGWR